MVHHTTEHHVPSFVPLSGGVDLSDTVFMICGSIFTIVSDITRASVIVGQQWHRGIFFFYDYTYEL